MEKTNMNVGPLAVRSNGSANFNVAKPNRNLHNRYACLRIERESCLSRGASEVDVLRRLDCLHKEVLAGAKHRGVDSRLI